MASYTPEFLASVRHDVEDTDLLLPAIAKKHEIGLRTLHRWIDKEGWKKRSERLRDLPPAARLLNEATALLTARGEAHTPDTPPRHCRFDGTSAIADSERTATPSVLGPRFRGDDTDGISSNPNGAPAQLSAIERLERLVEKELDAEEAVRAQLGPLPRNAADAERTARTLSTLTQTLHALQRLRGGTIPDIHDDDDMPRDIDEFRRELARRIEAFVASRTGQGDAGCNSAAVVETAG